MTRIGDDMEGDDTDRRFEDVPSFSLESWIGDGGMWGLLHFPLEGPQVESRGRRALGRD